MNYSFEAGYQEGLQGAATLGPSIGEDEMREQLERTVDLGLIVHAGYWSGRLTTYGSDVTLDDGTTLSY